MSVRASVVCTIVLSLGLTCSAQLPNPNSSRYGATPHNLNNNATDGGVTGSVRSLDDRAITDARVELRSESGDTITNGYTDSRGLFTIPQVTSGNYEIVAVKGVNEVHERVLVMGGVTSVELRMPIQLSAAAGDNSVSIAQFRVPEKARKIYAKADEAMRKNKLDEAKSNVQKALDVFPAYAEALTLRGILEMSEGATEKGKADFDAAIKADPSYALAYVTMGAALNQAGKYVDATRSLIRAVSLQPTSWQAYFELAKSSLGQGNYKDALKQVSKACEISQEYPPVHLVRAHALLGLKMYQDAVGELELYLTRDSTSAAADAARKTLDSAKSFASMVQK
jgi:tetratricopeptide (TPR) repeat protein